MARFRAAASSVLLGGVGDGLGEVEALVEALGAATGGLSTDEPPQPALPTRITTAATAVASLVRIR
jgi:hypothetical protein